MPWLTSKVQRVVATLVLVAMWELVSRGSPTMRLIFSSPLLASRFVAANYRRLALDALYTGGEAVIGLACALLVGAALILLSARYPQIQAAATGVSRAFQVVPFVVFAPVITVAIGAGFVANAALAVLVGIFPLILVVFQARQQVPVAALDLIHVYRFRPIRALRIIHYPWLVPAAFAGAKVSAALCLVGAVVAEFMGARYGLGRRIFEASIRIDPESMVAAAAGVVLIAGILHTLISFVERRIVTWRA